MKYFKKQADYPTVTNKEQPSVIVAPTQMAASSPTTPRREPKGQKDLKFRNQAKPTNPKPPKLDKGTG